MLCGDDPTKRQLLLEGGGFSAIYAPDGQCIGQPLAEASEGLVIAELDLGLISLAKAAADPAGHYARPDVTRLLLNRTPGDRVVSPHRAGAGAEMADAEPPQPALQRADTPAAALRRAA